MLKFIYPTLAGALGFFLAFDVPTIEMIGWDEYLYGILGLYFWVILLGTLLIRLINKVLPDSVHKDGLLKPIMLSLIGMHLLSTFVVPQESKIDFYEALGASGDWIAFSRELHAQSIAVNKARGSAAAQYTITSVHENNRISVKSKANIRSGPGKEHDRIFSLNDGTEVLTIARVDNTGWSLILAPDNKTTGYIHDSLLGADDADLHPEQVTQSAPARADPTPSNTRKDSPQETEDPFDEEHLTREEIAQIEAATKAYSAQRKSERDAAMASLRKQGYFDTPQSEPLDRAIQREIERLKAEAERSVRNAKMASSAKKIIDAHDFNHDNCSAPRIPSDDASNRVLERFDKQSLRYYRCVRDANASDIDDFGELVRAVDGTWSESGSQYRWSVPIGCDCKTKLGKVWEELEGRKAKRVRRYRNFSDAREARNERVRQANEWDEQQERLERALKSDGLFSDWRY